MVGVSYLIIVIYYLCTIASCAKDCPKSCTCLGDYVDCSQKNLVSVPSDIPKWTSQLNLNNNRLRSFNRDAFKDLTELTELKINKNKIAVIPKDGFDSLKRLRILELNRNQLRDIEALTFKSLEQLTVLKLKRNRIDQLKDGAFFGLTRIKSLMLDYNSIQVISKSWLYGLENLKELIISHNIINNVDLDAWEFCQGLIILDLSNNLMKSIKKDTFKYLNDLQKLLLNNNNITFIEEDAFKHLPNLRVLQLNNNKISWTIEDVRGVFSSLNNLVNFSIASNNIKSVSKNAFKGLTSLVQLDLSNNNITSIQRNAFIEMSLLEELALNTTALVCDCNLQWFYDWLMLKKFNVRTICSYPEWLRGQPLLSVPANNFTCDDLPKPRLIEEPEPEIMALKGENISLSCKAMSSASEVVATTLDGKNTESTSILNIYKVQRADAGKYQCVVSNKYGATYSQKSSISVLIFPTFVKIPHNVTVQAGTTVRLECAAHGEPNPEIAWQKDGGNDFPAARERRMHVMPDDHVFFIINAKQNDMGVYSCTANNPAGTIVANATLTIEEMPSFVKPMEDKEITAGESVVLQCMAGGAPKPTIQWLKDDGPIHATERHFFTAEDQLMIIVDTVLSDAGVYQCQLNNSLGIEIGYSTLHVKPGVSTENELMGIIIITVVCCAVLTSIVWVVIIYQTRKRMPPPKISAPQLEPAVLDFTDKTLAQFGDNTSEHSSCKDSGTGDSAKRSNDDLLPGDEFTLIINENNPDNKAAPVRTASLVYVVADVTNSHTPLLHKDETPYPRSTNHDRLEEPVPSTSEIQIENMPPEALDGKSDEN
ncbi:hypothetical protein ILUMI_24300 [Ignelater luminosus]|uniref:Ig-like domain-containing protein n=1 Tax=Ignelater luminosus TaxID=2038154 RepID=A0A8K0CC84_IGNLU|nr:hypothetical protein ILUMI_24300 [Ignelater luminosus]